MSVYRDERFPAVPAASNSLRAMEAVLTDQRLCGWPADRVTVLANPSDNRQVATTIRRLAQETGDVLLFYYVGHGTLTPTGELCLILSDTDADAADLTSLEYARLRAAFRDSPARVKAAILDCCYSGRAIETLADEAALLADYTDVRGVYTLTASDLAAHVPPPDEQATACTSFTEQLLDLIRSGIPGQGDPLTLGTLYTHLRRRLRALGLPDPNQRGTDTAHSFAFTRNAAAHPFPEDDATRPLRARRSTPPPDTASPAVPEQKRPQLSRRRLLIATGTVAGATAATVATVAAINIPAWLRNAGTALPTGTGSSGPKPGATRTAGVPDYGTSLGPTMSADPDMSIYAVAAGALNGRVIAVTGDGLPHGNPPMPDDPDQGTLRVWDLVAGKQVASVKTGSRVETVALGRLRGQPIAVTGCWDAGVRLWNLNDLKQIGSTLKATEDIFAVAVGGLNGKDVAVALSRVDIRVWDMNKGTQIAAAIEMPEHYQINDMALAQVKGKTVAVVGGYDHELRLWDLDTSGEVGKALRHGKTIYGLAVSTLNGKPVAVASYGVGMRMWDLVAGKLIGTTFGSTAVSRIASGTLNGRPIVVADHVNGGIQVWDLTTRGEVGDALRSGEITALTVTAFNGVSIAVACTESTVRGWALGAS
ncbi:hypothetical protein HD596_005477 [Nonomuraea jabiensis]|uniref:Peptidase C14 caspase domain-containing protein n=1 Tax=Nonomuraea jabiensis TaxID=882448 RepID=A0A7W9LCE9_9ACTN|nr:hypothetical protein [Nonomuraea jabiensis]